MTSTRKRVVETRPPMPRRTRKRAAPLHTTVPLPLGGEQEFFFPDGLFGLTSYRHFVLSHYQPTDGSASPFFLLNAKDGTLSLPLIEPQRLVADYHLALPPEILSQLGAHSPTELVVLVIVTLRERLEDITANLQGPVLLNPVSGLGLQLIAEQYPVRYPLLAPAPEQHPSFPLPRRAEKPL